MLDEADEQVLVAVLLEQELLQLHIRVPDQR